MRPLSYMLLGVPEKPETPTSEMCKRNRRLALVPVLGGLLEGLGRGFRTIGGSPFVGVSRITSLLLWGICSGPPVFVEM